MQIDRGPASFKAGISGIVSYIIPLTIAVRASATPGQDQATIFAEVHRGDLNEEFGLAVDWNVQSLYEVDPPHFFFGPGLTSSKGTVSRTVSIRTTDGAKWSIASVQLPHPFKAIFESGSGEVNAVTVSVSFRFDQAIALGRVGGKD